MTPDAIARRAAREHAAYVAAVGRVAVYAPAIPTLPEWVRRAQESRLPVKEYAR
jgi:hypothetical protein